MEDITPTFCKDHLVSAEKDSINFSVACEGLKNPKPKGKYSCSNVNIKTKSPHKNKKEKSKFKASRKRHHSQKFNLKKIEDDDHSNDVSEKFVLSGKSNNFSLKIKKAFDNNDISILMKKHKFKLRNDFDKKHTEQFLSSKEIAFEMPFLLDKNML